MPLFLVKSLYSHAISWRAYVMRANTMQVNPCIYVKDFIGDPDKMAGSHFSGSTRCDPAIRMKNE